jgi:hypothetical protein
VTTDELLHQAELSGTAMKDERINNKVLEPGKKNGKFIAYHHIPEDLRPIPKERNFYGGKWHWVKGVQDCSSNDVSLTKVHSHRELYSLSGSIRISEGLPDLLTYYVKTKIIKPMRPLKGTL